MPDCRPNLLCDALDCVVPWLVEWCYDVIGDVKPVSHLVVICGDDTLPVLRSVFEHNGAYANGYGG